MIVPSRLRPLALVTLYGVLSVVFCWPLFDQPHGLGANDWDQHLFYYASFLKNVVEYGQAPFWNPWYCGGNVMWQNPQMAVFSPVYPLTAVTSLQLAMKINIVLHYWISFVGMHLLLTRVIGVTFLPAVIYLATLVTASGAPAIHLRVGHSVFLPGFYLPLQLYWFFSAFTTGRWKYVMLAAASLALMVFNGGTHILPMSIAALGVFAICAAAATRQWRPLAIVLVFGIAAIAYSAPKLLPVVEFVNGDFFWDTRNPTEKPDRMTLEMLRQTYLVPTQDVAARLPMQRHGWHEYGNFIGAGSALALVIGVLFVLARRSPRHHWFGVSLALTTIALFLLSLGEFAPWSPAVLSQALPLFSSFRIPSRYTIVALQFAALTLGWAFVSATTRFRFPRAARLAVAGLAMVASAQLIVTNRWNLTQVFNEPSFDTSFHWMAGPHVIETDTGSSPYTKGSPMLHALMQNRAFYTCYESLQLARGAGGGPPVVDASPSHRVADVDFTPNRLRFTVKDGTEPARVVLNQNWSPGWTTAAGAISVGPRTELAAVTIPPGTTGRYDFSFFPSGLLTGTIVCLAAVALSAIAWRKRFPPIAPLQPPR